MRRRGVFIWVVVLSVSAHAQWLNSPTPGTPRTRDGKPDLAAPTPRTAVFVVETAGFNDKVPLDIVGHPHSEDLRITERFRRTNFGHMDMEVTFTDLKMYTKPFTIKVGHTLLADADIFESFCENERDRVHLENAKQQPR